MGSLFFFFSSFLCLLPSLRSPAPRAMARASPPFVINEVYYDHPGTDDGYEFIEIMNNGADAASLDGVAVVFHNGSGEGWEVRWSGGAGDSVAAGGLFLVGGDRVLPAPDVAVALALQNGPDAVGLTHAGATLDVVAYGGLDDAAYVETRSAPGTGAGRSLARIPDGADSDDNAADFAVEIPSPGRRNVPIHDVALATAPPTPVRDVRAGAGSERLHLNLRNAGQAGVAAGAVAVAVDDSTESGTVRAAQAANATALAPGEAADLDVDVFLAPGIHWLTATARYAPDERAFDDAVILVRRVGPLELLVSEVLAAAREGCPQFVEIHNAGAQPRALNGFRMRDRTHAPALLTADSLWIEPGGFLAFTPDSDALRGCFPRARPDRVVDFAGAWPSLNRSGGVVADSVILVDALGLAVDAVAYPSLAAGDARSLERVDLFWPGAGGVWVASRDPAGATPGAGPAHAVTRPVAAGEVRVSPNPFAPEAGQVLEIALAAGAGVGSAAVDVYDVGGRLVEPLGAADAFPAVFVWAGAGAPPGIYVVACRWYDAAGNAAGVEKVVVGRAGAR